MKKSAIFSPCELYRYALWRVWNEELPYAMFIGLNPSTADDVQDDPTILRCINYAQTWGYGGLCMGNLFAYRSTNRHVLKSVKEPVGPENDEWINRLSKDAGIVVAAWGDDGKLFDRAKVVTQMVPNLYCLLHNSSGQPAHPLYSPQRLEPTLYKVPLR